MPLLLRHQIERRRKALGKRQGLGVVYCGERRRYSCRGNCEQGNCENQTAHFGLLCELDYPQQMGRLCFRTVSSLRKMMSLKRL